MYSRSKRHSKAISLIICMVMITTLFIVATPNTVVAATYDVEGHTDINCAYNMGTFSDTTIFYAHTWTGKLYAYETSNWYKFTASAGDKIAIAASYATLPSTAGNSFTLTLKSSTGVNLQTSSSLVGPQSTPNLKYLLVKETIKTNGAYYIEVKRTGSDIDKFQVASVHFVNRTKSSNGTYTLSPTSITCAGSGAISTIASVNLTSNSTIPVGAIVKTIYTTGTQTPSQGNVYHQVKPSAKTNWYVAKVANASNGTINISTADNEPVKTTWQFSYKASATASSTMKNISITINYEYDQTDGWN